MTKEVHVLSVRLSAKKMALLKDAAAREGGRISDVVREALASYATRRHEATVQWAVPANSRVFMYRGGPARSESRGSSNGIAWARRDGQATQTFTSLTAAEEGQGS